MEQIPTHNQIYTIEFTVADGRIVVNLAPAEVQSLLKDHDIRDLVRLPMMPGRYRAELKFYFYDGINTESYAAEYGFKVQVIHRLLTR